MDGYRWVKQRSCLISTEMDAFNGPVASLGLGLPNPFIIN